LFVDVLRPLVFPLSLVNRSVVWTTARTPAISVLMDRARKRAFPPTKPAGPPEKSRAANA
jgi:hypothetical protein